MSTDQQRAWAGEQVVKLILGGAVQFEHVEAAFATMLKLIDPSSARTPQ